MTKTFYVPNSEAESIDRFLEICEATKTNYSNLMVDWIKRFNSENTHIKAIKKQDLKK